MATYDGLDVRGRGLRRVWGWVNGLGEGSSRMGSCRLRDWVLAILEHSGVYSSKV